MQKLFLNSLLGRERSNADGVVTIGGGSTNIGTGGGDVTAASDPTDP